MDRVISALDEKQSKSEGFDSSDRPSNLTDSGSSVVIRM